MRNVMKAATLESKFPILAVEHDCIISKDADITVAYKVELPELFTVTRNEYEAIHSAWAKAVKVLPNYSIVHRQDWFIEENYTPDIQRDDLSFLSRFIESEVTLTEPLSETTKASGTSSSAKLMSLPSSIILMFRFGYLAFASSHIFCNASVSVLLSPCT